MMSSQKLALLIVTFSVTAGSSALSQGASNTAVTLNNQPISEAMIVSDNSMPFEDISSDCVFGNSKLFCHSWGFKQYLQTTVREYGDAIISCVTIRERREKCFWELGFEDEDTEEGKCCEFDAGSSSAQQVASAISSNSTVVINANGDIGNSDGNTTEKTDVELPPSTTKACTCFPTPPISSKWGANDMTVILGSLGAPHSCLRLWATGTDSEELAAATLSHEGEDVATAMADAQKKAEEEKAQKELLLAKKGLKLDESVEEDIEYVDSEANDYNKDNAADQPKNVKQVTNADGVTYSLQVPATLSSTNAWTQCKPKSRKQQWTLYAPTGVPKSAETTSYGVQGKKDLRVNVIIRNHATKMCVKGLAAEVTANNKAAVQAAATTAPLTSEEKLAAALKEMEAASSGGVGSVSADGSAADPFVKKAWNGVGLQKCVEEPSGTDFTFEVELIRRGAHRGFSRLRKAYASESLCLTLTEGGSIDLLSCDEDASNEATANLAQLFYVNSRSIRQDAEAGEQERLRREKTIAAAQQAGENLALNNEAALKDDNKNWQNDAQSITFATGGLLFASIIALTRV